MMPYEAFHTAAVRARYDIDVLRSRFGVSFEQAATRLTMLQRAGAAGVPFFLLEVDKRAIGSARQARKVFRRRASAAAARSSPVHAAFAQPGQILVEAVEMPDGAEFLTIARTLEGPQGAFQRAPAPHRVAARLRYRFPRRDRLRRGTARRGSAPKPATYSQTPVGPACRLCERAGCLARAEPPVTRPLGLDEMVTGLSAFDFQ